MVVAKTDMSGIPSNCWNCDLIHEASNGYTVCSILHESLYPMGIEKILDDCPLVETEDES